MGEVISKSAAIADIAVDVHSTLVNAAARGGQWKQHAEEKLLPAKQLMAHVEQRHADAVAAVAPLLAAAAVGDSHADRLLGRISDEVWNALDRPANDPWLSVLFPGGIAYYAEGSDGEQPARMTLLAELLEGGVHPRLDQAAAKEWATEIRQEADRLAVAIEAANGPATRVELLGRVRTAVARTAQIQLANLKRTYRASGLTEADIHTVIPDRSQAKKKEPAAAEAKP